MTERRATCFVSYCHEDADLNSIHYLIRQLREECNNQIHFFFDEDATGGIKLTDFMSQIRNVDAILLLLTPQYRKRVLERKGGVYVEFTEILRRFHDDEKRANDHTKHGDDAVKPPPVCFKPLIFAGDFNSACPEEIKEYLCKDFSGYRAHKDAEGRLFTTRPVITRYRSNIEEIASDILARHAASAPDFEVRFRKVLRSLFLETKHERLTGDDVFQKVAKSIFVKTHVYGRVKEQISYILVGRKGSGKSTITNYLPELGKKHYKEPININVNEFGLEYLYGMLSMKQVWSEAQTVVERSRLFEWTREAFIIVCCMEVLVSEATEGTLTDPNANDLMAFSNFLHRVSGESDRTEAMDKNATFRWCLTQVLDRLNRAISDARPQMSEFHYDIAKMLERSHVLKAILTPALFESFERTVKLGVRHFLISLDGFDTLLEEFRKRSTRDVHDAKERRNRTNYEIDWLRGLLHVAADMKSGHHRSALTRVLDFCITLPKERFMEIMREERDAVIYVGKASDIRWSGIELSIMLRKRLDQLGNFTSDRNKRPRERLQQVLSERFPYVPQEVNASVGGREYRLDLFNYVLRHTFWRPREIIIYFARILLVLKDLNRKNTPVTRFTVAKCVADTTRSVIGTEFINEFQHHCPGLVGIIEKFRAAPQIMSVAEVRQRLADVDFAFIDRDIPVQDFKSKMVFLYSIGFLGVEVTDELKQRRKLLSSDVFSFNETEDVAGDLINEDLKGCGIIIHPAFCEYLSLDTSKQRLALNVDWEYLAQQEAHMFASI